MKNVMVLWGLTLCVALTGCPDIPTTPPSDALAPDALGDGGDVFIPLEFHRIYESVGEPTGGERISLYGAGFVKGAKVFFGQERSDAVLVLDSGQINCDVPPGEQGLVDVTIVLSDGQEATLEASYLYRGPFELHTISPEAGPSRQETQVTLRGAFFEKTTRILVGGRLLKDAKLIDEETIEGVVPARLQGHSGWVDVIATNGFEQRTLRRAFRMTDDLRLLWIDPPSGDSKGGGIVTLYGGGLTQETLVKIGGKVAETLVAPNGNTITIRVPPLPHGPMDVEVSNGQEARILEGAFYSRDSEQLPAALTLLGVWPDIGQPAGGTNLALTVHGLPVSGAAQDLSVTINDSPATLIEVSSAQSLIVIEAPPGQTGQATIAVKRLEESSVRADIFTYETAFAITKVVPSEGPLDPTQGVILQGEGFVDGVEVLFGNRPAVVQNISDGGDKITVSAPSGVPGRVDVQVRLGAKIAIAPSGFHYLHEGPARVLGLSPPNGGQAGGRVLRLFGEGLMGFVGPLRMGSELMESVEILDDATLLLRSPRGETGSLNVDGGEAGLLAMVYELFDPTSKYGGTSGGPIPEALNVTVLEMSKRKPIEDAFVILWDDVGTPYQGITDERGQITFSDAGFGPPQMVTAAKDMHTTSSVVQFDARNVTLFLYSFVPSPPGDGQPTPPDPIPNGSVKGEVTGLSKYVVLPPGNCDSMEGSWPPTLCDVCEDDSDCEGEGARCLELGEQGKRCTTQCVTDDDCPVDFVCTGMGFGAIQCVPQPGKKTAFCAATQQDVFSYEGQEKPEEEGEAPSAMGPGTFTNDESIYALPTAPGEQAIVCFGGYLDVDESTGESLFIPLRMGVRRHVFVEPGMEIDAQDIRLDIPLDRTLRLRLDGAPTEDGSADRHGVDVFLDFGGDGVFRMPQRGFAIGKNDFVMENFPTKFEDSLYDVTYTVLARAYSEKTALGESNNAAFVLMSDIEAVGRDSVFEVVEKGAVQTQYGIDTDVHGIHGVGERLWAAGDAGRILVFDGTWWGLKQTPTKERLNAVFARNEQDIIAVGAQGSILRSQGLVWFHEDIPQKLQGVSWWAVHGVGSAWWLSGEAGLWSFDGESFQLLLGDEGGRPQRVRGLWSASADSAWIAGEGGLLRRWGPAGFESFDVPGGDLLGLAGTHNADVWAVGEKGRILHFDGLSFFEYLPLTDQTLRAVHAVSEDNAWAVGDGGVVLHWDGQSWSHHTQVEHIDFRAVGVNVDGALMVGGLPVLVVGPFLPIPEAVNPNGMGQFMGSPISWKVAQGALPTMTLVGLAEENGFPFWWLFVEGGRRHVPLPDLQAAWGLMAIWPGQGFLRLTSFYIPEVSIDKFDYTTLNQFSWRSWSVADFPVLW